MSLWRFVLFKVQTSHTKPRLLSRMGYHANHPAALKINLKGAGMPIFNRID